MPLGDAPMAVLAAALRASSVVIRHRAKIVTVPGSECLWWRGAVSGRGHGRFYVGTVVAVDPGESGRDLCVIAHRFGYGSRRRHGPATKMAQSGVAEALPGSPRPTPNSAAGGVGLDRHVVAAGAVDARMEWLAPEFALRRKSTCDERIESQAQGLRPAATGPVADGRSGGGSCR